MNFVVKPKLGFCCSLSARLYSKLVTTPIFYVNADPHVGHLYTAVLTDAWARFQRLRGETVLFSTGTDEHGLKVQQAAERLGVPVGAYCDDVASRFKTLFRNFDVEPSDFVRTTEGRHVGCVTDFWRRLSKSGLVSKGRYEGWYDAVDECFVSEVDLEPGSGDSRVTKDSKHSVVWSSEENYVFDLPAMRQDLLSWANKEGTVHPPAFKKNLSTLLEGNLQKLSISRPSSRLYWGVPVPDDPGQTIYVWLDALVNYLTVSGYPEAEIWPGTHVIGKDILKFHGVYWPAFLIAAQMSPPRRLVVHSHWLVDDTKMSKSLGNTVDPSATLSKYSSDGWRYFLLREGVLGHDGNFNGSKMAAILNAELADTLGNLVLRCTSASLNPDQTFPACCGPVPSSDELTARAKALPTSVEKQYSDFYFYRGLEEIQDVLRRCNAFVQASEPWVMKKKGDVESLGRVVYVCLETCRSCAVMLQPVVPQYAARILDVLGVPRSRRSWSDAAAFDSGETGWPLLKEKVQMFNKIR